jgi:gliding motility-associated-like protein
VKKANTIFTILLMLGLYAPVRAQLVVGTSMTPAQLVQNVLVGTGVTVSNVTYSGVVGSLGNFTGGGTTNLGISSGVIMSTGLVNGTPAIGSAVGNNASTSHSMSPTPDADLYALSGYDTYDVASLEFDFIPLSDTIKFRYVFASEEYPEFVGLGFNDVFGFFVTGPNPLGGNYSSKNIALLPGTTLPVAIDNVNSGSYAIYFIDNAGMSGATIVYDGFTTVLTAWCLVTPCKNYHIKLAIGDAGDSVFDSAVFLEANSFSTNAVSISTFYTVPMAGSNAVEGCSDGIISFHLPSATPIPFNVTYTITGTATNGVDYTNIPTSVTIPAGQDSVSLIIHPIVDGIPEGTETVSLIVQTSVCGGYDTVNVAILDNQTMNIITSNDTTICAGSANIWAQVTGGIPTYFYTWSSGAGSASSAVVSPVVTTTYTITVTDICGSSATDNVTIYWGQGTADAGNDVTLCAGESTTLTAVGGTGGYLWSNGTTTASNSVTPAATTIYYVTAYGACNAFDSVTVFVNPSPAITATASSASIYMGDVVILSAGGGTAYQWYASPFDPSLSGQINSPSPAVTPQATTTYSVVGYDANGCSGSASVVVVVVPIYPEVNFYANPVSGCEPLIVQFTDTSSKVSPGAIYLWDFGNGYGSNLINPMAYYPHHGVYSITLTITNPGGYTGAMTQFDMITVHPKPVAIFETLPNREVTVFESTLSFFDKTIGSPSKWDWSFGDGDTSDQKDPYHEYLDTGSYTVVLKVTTQYGCTDTATTVVMVRPDYYIYVPNAFTPNEDGKNDIFFVQSGRIIPESFEMRIFTRWGQQIYFSDDLYKGWDGKYNDINANCDTYVYEIRFMDETYKTHRVTGTITLIR